MTSNPSSAVLRRAAAFATMNVNGEESPSPTLSHRPPAAPRKAMAVPRSKSDMVLNSRRRLVFDDLDDLPSPTDSTLSTTPSSSSSSVSSVASVDYDSDDTLILEPESVSSPTLKSVSDQTIMHGINASKNAGVAFLNSLPEAITYQRTVHCDQLRTELVFSAVLLAVYHLIVHALFSIFEIYYEQYGVILWTRVCLCVLIIVTLMIHRMLPSDSALVRMYVIRVLTICLLITTIYTVGVVIDAHFGTSHNMIYDTITSRELLELFSIEFIHMLLSMYIVRRYRVWITFYPQAYNDPHAAFLALATEVSRQKDTLKQ